MNKHLGSQRDEAPAGRNPDSPPSSAEHYPDEHTRLLPNRVDSTPYLSPDDPAVSPYNLWTVRLVRYATVVLTCITFVWWVLMFVSAFITPPGLHARGSPWFAFSYATISLLTLLVTLLFFAVPSKSSRLLSIVAAGLLLVGTIIIAAVEKMRHEELWIGVASAVWATLVTVWVVGADRVVQWGKTEEEERLTGRPETRRTLLEWVEVLLSSVVLTAVAAVVLLMTANLAMRALDARLAPPGERYWVDGDKYQIHLYCHGNQTDTEGRRVTTVLLEGGEDPVEHTLWQLADNALKNGSIGRYCFADRPGVAWSDTAPSPLSASMASDALGEALSRAGETGPWVLASAGIGSLYSRVFSSRHGEEVRGILMIDPLHEDLLGRVGAPGRGFLLWLRGVISPVGLDRLTGAVFRGRSAADRTWGRAAYQSGSSIFAKLQESLVADSFTKRDVTASRTIQNQKTPVVVISSGQQIRRDSEWEAKQRDLTHLTSNLEDWDIVDEAPHEAWQTFKGRELIEKRLKKLVKAR
ncbi:hypothetical protein B0T26DRAFT_635107 [Lasiosphaeria miniovina]|uniref:Uncharacterized protein n=1 Tax=Lasiosphaeria miniovina TaxID=1954250 RepID=A0AA40BGN5_9PEZI|nr:uncharacterized protein B0T26DRAFT_635107 [Lasiosphaeria miniovina]KAK0733886.1 hypothetical protein B0T26DRAFT_635107 [Lasiosphaeria miniovina]